MVMTAAAVKIALGRVRRASTSPSPVVEALSTPANANAIVDQKMTSFRPVLGSSDCALIGVADPYFIQEYDPNAISSDTGTQPARALVLVLHLPTSRPTMFRPTATARPRNDTTRK